jgi:hypothetical protein
VPAKPKFSVQFILLVKIALNNVLELYEVIVNFFYFFFCLAEQSVVDRAINDICILLQCSRHNLNVVDATLVSPWNYLWLKDTAYERLKENVHMVWERILVNILNMTVLLILNLRMDYVISSKRLLFFCLLNQLQVVMILYNC